MGDGENMKIKAWHIYIWIPFIFALVCWVTYVRISGYERKNNIGVFEDQSLRIRYIGRFFLFGVIAGLPVLIVSTYSGDEMLIVICYYLGCVFAAYRDARWREKHLVHMSKRAA